MSYQRKTRLNWTLTEKDHQPLADLIDSDPELFLIGAVAMAVGTALSIFLDLSPSGKSSLINLFSEATQNGKRSTSVASSTATRPTSYSKGKSSERKKIPRKSNR